MATRRDEDVLAELELELAPTPDPEAAPLGRGRATVVLLHAFPLDERMWEPQRAALADYEVVVPRLYGRGSSMDGWADALLGELDGELFLVGASMGGYAALAMVRRAPDRVSAVVLAGARLDADSEERRAGRADTIRLIEREGAAGLWESMRPKLLSDGAPAEAVERARAIVLEQEPGELVAAVEAIRDRADSTAAAGELGDRLLLIVGEHDPFFGIAEALALGTGRVEVADGAGHLANLERPDEFNNALLEFLARWT